MDIQSFYAGQVFDAHEYLGAHTVAEGTVFRAFAPAATGMTIVHHDGFQTEMKRIHDGNFWEGWVPNLTDGDPYELRVYLPGGGYQDHADPYAFGSELRPQHRSIVRDLSGFAWHDEEWLAKRTPRIGEPLNIYELHLGSWRKKGGEAAAEPSDDTSLWYTYDEIAEPLVDYLTSAGYNYVEFMPLAEYPDDASWGYQGTGFFAPTSRYGTPKQLMALIDALHQAGIGAILDFVPVHFALDDWALRNFDGTALYEYPNTDVGVSEWGSCNFMYSRGESCSFMQSCAHHWLDAFHFDGLRMDAISRIIYWMGDPARGVNNENVRFVTRMNSGLKHMHPGCILAAEDSTDYPGTTKGAAEGGLGFDYKWDMGWMNDTLDFFKKTPEERKANYHKLTFSMMYFPNERYLLPLSHDENVHGKATVLNKMYGDYWDKFPQARVFYLYMYVHPGKKLNFMGGEFGQMREWDERREQDWDMLGYPVHDAFAHYMAELSKIYLDHGALSEWDYYAPGFTWLDCNQEQRCLYAIERKNAGERLVAVLNMGGEEQTDFAVAVPGVVDGCDVLLHTDWDRWGGKTTVGGEHIRLVDGTLTVTLPAFSGVLLKVYEPAEQDAAKQEESEHEVAEQEAVEQEADEE